MSHEVETMMYNLETGVPWHGLGTPVQGAVDSEEALARSGLLWAVETRPVFVGGLQVPGYAATVRTTDQRVLGVVSERYRPVQNREAFNWTDALLGEGARYESAGSLRGGQRVWLLARLEDPVQLAGDDALTYLVFSNSHDGSGAVKVALTPVRVVCANTLAWALSGARRSWSAMHVGDMASKLEAARESLQLARQYVGALADEADRLADQRADAEEYAERLLPIPGGATARTAATVRQARADILTRSEAADLAAFRGTGWAFVNAVADHVGHADPLRQTETFGERRFERIVDGDPLLQRARDLVAAQ